MDQQSPTRTTAQSSIRSFFQPLLQQQQQQNHAPPAAAPPPQTTTSLFPKPTIPSSPPPVRSPSSYALPPNKKATPSPSQTNPRQPLPQNSNLPEGAAILPVTEDHITSLRRINALLLPIAYPDAFYNAITSPSLPFTTNFSRVITWDGKVIGGIICGLEISLPLVPANSISLPPNQSAAGAEEVDIYIQSLCLLSPYRGKGLVSQALDEIIQATTQQDQRIARIKGLYAHVWTSNEEALEWYAKKGFTVWESGVVRGYYRRLKPDTAWILRRQLVPSDHLSSVAKASSPLVPETQLQEERPASTPTTATSKLRPPPIHQARSFQDRGPEREWNDLPEDVSPGNGLLKPAGGSNASSRSSSRSGLGDGSATVGRGKKKRVYPAAAFGS